MRTDGETTKAEDDDNIDPAKLSRHWQMQLAIAEKNQKEFVDDGRKVVERYKSERNEASRKATSNRKFNILYSNTEVLRAALFGKMAKPDVRRRFADRNPVAREVAEVIERSLVYQQDIYPSERYIDLAIMDYLLPGRGVVRVEYEPVIGEKPKLDMMGQPVMGEDGMPETEEFIAEQKLCEKYVFWEDYLCEPARNWEQVTWEAFRHNMSRDDLDDEIFENAVQGSQVFGTAADVPLNWTPDIGTKERDTPEELKKAEVWEVWDKKERKRLWIVKGYDKPLRIDEDPYQLEEFWPNAEPLNSYSATDDFIPEAEFKAYQDQADDLDEITARISRLTRALKRRGVYDKAIVELKRLASAGDNEFIPVSNYAELLQKGGLQAAFQVEDIQVTATVLKDLYEQRNALIQAIYEITGISDIVRGATNPNETLGAQQLKAQFGSNRLKRRQNDVARWIRDIYRLKAEIIAEHFEPDVLSRMTGIQVTPEMMAILRDEKARGYQIDVETDSTSFEDAEAEKKSRVEYITATSQFMAAMLPVVQQAPQFGPLIMEMLAFGTRGFKAGRELEDRIDQMTQKIEDAEKQPKPPPPPDPEIEKAKAQMAIEQQRAQADLSLKGADYKLKELDYQIKQVDLQQKSTPQLEAPQPQEDPLDREEKLLKVEHSRADLMGKQRALESDGKVQAANETDSGERAKHSENINKAVEGLMAVVEKMAENQQATQDAVTVMAKAIAAPKRVVRGPDGKAAGVETVMN